MRASLDRNALSDLISIETKQDLAYNLELGITQNPALCIEEETIEFRDMIFEGMIPADGCGTCGDSEESGDSCSTDSCHSH